ncbi:MAG: TonB-dependent receptor [Bacteroidales bacterium]|nr:TonB-dependent receptor [Bacteroidales bacterium]
MRTSVLFFLILSFSTAFGQMAPDTVSIPEVEVKTVRQLARAGVTTHQIDSIAMKRESDASLSDLLSRFSTVFVKSEGRGALSTVAFRGTAPSHTEVYWNGMSLQSPMLGQVDFSQIPVYLMDNISLNPGASSLVDGDGALGGSIDLKNDLSWSKKFSGTFLSGYGSFGTWNEFVHLEKGSDKFQSSTRIYYNRSKNDFPFINKDIANIDPVTGAYIYPRQRNEHAEYMLEGAMQSFGFRLSKRTILETHYWFQYSDRAIPRLNTYEGNDNSNLARQVDRTNRAVMKLSSFMKKGTLILQSGLNAENMVYSIRNMVYGDGYYNALYSKSNVYSFYNKAQYQFQPIRNALVKAAATFDFYRVQTKDTVNQTGYNQSRRDKGLMLSWQQQLTNNLSAMVLLRKDWVNQVSIPIIPYFGFDWTINQKRKLILHGNIARNYHYPDLNDLYWQPGGNPNLRPEEGLNTELGVITSFPGKKLENSFGLTAFYNNIENWIIWIPSPMGYWSPQNIQHVVSSGFDANVMIAFPIKKLKVTFKADYAFTKSINHGNAARWGTASVGKQIPFVPVHTGNVLLNLSLGNYYLTWINHSYSERFTTSTNELTMRDRLNPYFMNDLYIGKRWLLDGRKISLQFKIFNLFNEQYRSVLQRPMPGRNYMLLLTYHL